MADITGTGALTITSVFVRGDDIIGKCKSQQWVQWKLERQFRPVRVVTLGRNQ